LLSVPQRCVSGDTGFRQVDGVDSSRRDIDVAFPFPVSRLEV